MIHDDALGAELAARVTDRLAISGKPALPGLADLTDLFLAWCRAVPFDNALRFLALRESRLQALPGLRPEAFFRSWLADGCGGMCVPTASALRALLITRGYTAEIRAARLDQADVANHVTTVVTIPPGEKYALDTVGLPEEPVPLRSACCQAGRGIHRVLARPTDGSWQLTWRAPVHGTAMACRLGGPISALEVRQLYRTTQASFEISQFNTILYARTNVDMGIISVIGRHVYLAEHDRPARVLGRRAEDVLADVFGWSDSLLDRIAGAGAFT